VQLTRNFILDTLLLFQLVSILLLFLKFTYLPFFFLASVPTTAFPVEVRFGRVPAVLIEYCNRKSFTEAKEKEFNDFLRQLRGNEVNNRKELDHLLEKQKYDIHMGGGMDLLRDRIYIRNLVAYYADSKRGTK